MKWQAAVGLETHVQLATRTKIFCGCPNRFGAEPNTLTCPVCLGYPGVLPALNGEAVRLAVRAGLLLGSRIPRFSRFDRKQYFYPDMPKNYQITQVERPLCLGGAVEIETEGRRRAVALERIHLEEDVGKNLHFPEDSGVDFNRAGVPLIEIVTGPVLQSADEALSYLLALKRILVYGGVSGGNLEQGNLRCDVNVSVRPAGTRALGAKTEIKNLNTFKGVHRALSAEIARQVRTLEAGGRVRQETRRWDEATGATAALRVKEDARDYRYFPDPDLPPLEVDDRLVEACRGGLPEMPAARRERFCRQYGLPDYDAGVLTADRRCADFFEATVAAGAPPKAASNWIMTDLLAAIPDRESGFGALPLEPRSLAALIQMVEEGAVSRTAAKAVFAELLASGGEPARIVARLGLARVGDEGAVDAFARRAIAEHPQAAAAFRSGKEAALQHLVGQVMRMSRGKADPKVAVARLKQLLPKHRAEDGPPPVPPDEGKS